MPAANSSELRHVSKVVDAQQTVEGEGLAIRRAFPTRALSDIDPFLLLDHLGPVQYGPGQATGVPDHPHRGFETVTYLLHGGFEHRDSHGHFGHLGPGDVQWMTAGSGVVHSEMPDASLLRDGGRLEGFQIWVNLPKARKMTEPRYQEVAAAKSPLVVSGDGLVSVRVIAGEAMGKKAVIDTYTPIMLLHYELKGGARVSQSIPPGYNAFAYVVEGSVDLGMRVEAGQVAVFETEGSLVDFKTEAGCSLLILGGVPLNEPVARYGPFVMNNQDEIHQAFQNYRNGRM